MKKQKEEETINIGTPESLASEMYRELKKANQFKTTVILWLCGIILALVAAMGILSWYHIHMWSQFDTVVVDTGEGGGNANYIQGDNQGGVYNYGEGDSEKAPEGQVPGNPD